MDAETPRPRDAGALPTAPIGESGSRPSFQGAKSLTIALILVVLLVRVLLQPLLRSVLMFHQPVRAAIRANLPYLAALVLVVGLCACFLIYRRRSVAAATNWAWIVLGIGIVWPSPMILEPGAILDGNWGAQMRAALLIRDAIWSGEFPGYTFRQANGASYLTQYPPLATWLEAIPMMLGVEPEFAMKLVAFLIHVALVFGVYCLLRRLGVRALPAAAGTVSVYLTQQYWTDGMYTGSIASWCAAALIAWCSASLIRLIDDPSAVRALLVGAFSGLLITAHPVYTLFFFYFIVLGLLAAFIWLSQRLRRATPFLALSATVAMCVGAPYVVPMLLYRSYNLYQPGDVRAYQFPPPVFSRTLVWSAHVGSPPGVGHDFTGYIGVILWASFLIAPFLILSGRLPAGIKRLQLTVYLLFAALALYFVYGSNLPLYRFIPFVYLNKSANRLTPFLLVMLAVGLAICCDRLSKRPRLLALLIGAALLEQMPFCTRTYFTAPDTMPSFLEAAIGHQPGQEVLSADDEVYDRVYRAITLDRVSDFYYVHHEEIGAASAVYWDISNALRNGDCSVMAGGLPARLASVGVTHLFLSHNPAPCFEALGTYSSAVVDAAPVYVIHIDSNARMDRQISKMAVPAAPERSDNGRQLLPISYYPGLAARQGDRSLQLFNRSGFVEACCVSTIGGPITVVHSWPVVYYAAYVLSLGLLVVTVLFAIRNRGRVVSAE